MTKNLKSIIFILSTRPNTIIYNQGIFGLASFLSGYFYGKKDYELENYEIYFRDSFHTWVRSHYDCELNQSWSNIIYFYEGGGDVAIVKFLELFEIFLSGQPHY